MSNNSQDFVLRVKAALKERMKAAIEEGKARMGPHPGREVQSPEQQMKAYLSMSNQDWSNMVMAKGIDEASAFSQAMQDKMKRMKPETIERYRREVQNG